MAQIEGKIRRALIALARIDFETMQDDFLEPWRQIGPQAARRQRRAGKPLAPLADGARLAERPRAGGEEIQEHTEREQIAAPVVANVEQLLRRNIDAGADRACELFAGKIGQIESRERPKSSSTTSPLPASPPSPPTSRIMMLLGLRSRWMTRWR